MTDEQAEGSLPLEGITVLALDRIVAGPFAAMVLSDLGAEVINVEATGTGDPYRDGTLPVEKATFNAIQRNRKSIALDLKTDEGKEVYFDLVREADVVLENFGRGVAERLGVGYEDCEAVNPRIVYASVKGFFEGEYGDRKALDAVAQAMSGMMTMTGEDRAMRAGTSVSDMSTGLYAVIGVLAALQRPPEERGERVEAGLFESAVSFMNYWIGMYQVTGEHPTPLGRSHPLFAPYTVFDAAGGDEVFVGVMRDDEWEAMCEAFGFENLLAEERYATNESRVANMDELTGALQERFAEMDRDAILEVLLDLDITVADVKTIDEVLEDPHLDGIGMYTTVNADYDGQELRVPLTPIKSTGYEIGNGTDTPALGEHTDELLARIGYDDDEVATLREEGVVE